MPGDLAIQAASVTPGASSAAQTSTEPGSAAASTTSGGSAGAKSAAAAAAASTTISSQSLHTNPVSQLDPALGIVVLGFYNNQGVETSSIPTQKQLNSYRLHGETPASAAHPEHPVTSET
jgi:hypothetical protein